MADFVWISMNVADLSPRASELMERGQQFSSDIQPKLADITAKENDPGIGNDAPATEFRAQYHKAGADKLKQHLPQVGERIATAGQDADTGAALVDAQDSANAGQIDSFAAYVTRPRSAGS